MSLKEIIKVANYYQLKYNLAVTAQNEPKKVLYTGVVLDDSSMQTLREKLKEVCPEECEGWLDSNVGSHGHEQLNHHMTLAASPASKVKNLDQSLLDSGVALEVVGFGLDAELGIAGWQVNTNLPVQSGNPHITALLRDESVKPFLAGKIKSWTPVSPIKVTGFLQEVTPL